MDLKMVEEALYLYKYLPARISELEIEMDLLYPPSPGSVLKMTGRPMAKTPLDTSQTETWGIIRATCDTGQTLMAKTALRGALRGLQAILTQQEADYVHYRYGKELKRYQVLRRLGVGSHIYYSLGVSVSEKADRLISEAMTEQQLSIALDYNSTGEN